MELTMSKCWDELEDERKTVTGAGVRDCGKAGSLPHSDSNISCIPLSRAAAVKGGAASTPPPPPMPGSRGRVPEGEATCVSTLPGVL